MKAIHLILSALAFGTLSVVGYLDPSITTQAVIKKEAIQKYTHVFFLVDPKLKKSETCTKKCKLINYQFCDTSPYFVPLNESTVLDVVENHLTQLPSNTIDLEKVSSCLCVQGTSDSSLLYFLSPEVEIAMKLGQLEKRLEELKVFVETVALDVHAYYHEIMPIDPKMKDNILKGIDKRLAGLQSLKQDLAKNDYLLFSVKEAFYGLRGYSLKYFDLSSHIDTLERNQLNGNDEIKNRRESGFWGRTWYSMFASHSVDEQIQLLTSQLQNQTSLLEQLKPIRKAFEDVQAWLDEVPNYEAFPFMAQRCSNRPGERFALPYYVPLLSQEKYKFENMPLILLSFLNEYSFDCAAECRKFNFTVKTDPKEIINPLLAYTKVGYFTKVNLRGELVSISYVDNSLSSQNTTPAYDCFCKNPSNKFVVPAKLAATNFIKMYLKKLEEDVLVKLKDACKHQVESHHYFGSRGEARFHSFDCRHLLSHFTNEISHLTELLVAKKKKTKLSQLSQLTIGNFLSSISQYPHHHLGVLCKKYKCVEKEDAKKKLMSQRNQWYDRVWDEFESYYHLVTKGIFSSWVEEFRAQTMQQKNQILDEVELPIFIQK